jgi:hypothetical protein
MDELRLEQIGQVATCRFMKCQSTFQSAGWRVRADCAAVATLLKRGVLGFAGRLFYSAINR